MWPSSVSDAADPTAWALNRRLRLPLLAPLLLPALLPGPGLRCRCACWGLLAQFFIVCCLLAQLSIYDCQAGTPPGHRLC